MVWFILHLCNSCLHYGKRYLLITSTHSTHIKQTVPLTLPTSDRTCPKQTIPLHLASCKQQKSKCLLHNISFISTLLPDIVPTFTEPILKCSSWSLKGNADLTDPSNVWASIIWLQRSQSTKWNIRKRFLSIDWLIGVLTARQHRKVNLCQLRRKETGSVG